MVFGRLVLSLSLASAVSLGTGAVARAAETYAATENGLTPANTVTAAPAVSIANPAVSSTTIIEASPEPAPSIFHLDTLIETSTTLHTFDNPRKSSAAVMLLAPLVELGSWRPKALVQIDQPLSGGDTDPTVSRVDVGLGHAPIALNPYLRLSPSLWVTTPFGAGMRSRVSLIAAFRIAPRVQYSLERMGLPVSGFFEPSYTRSIHEFTTTTSGGSNAASSFSNRTYIGVDLGKGWSFATDLIFGGSWTYAGNFNSRFSWSEGIDKDLGDGWGAGVSISNAGTTLRANGYDSNVSLIDPETTQIAGSVSYAF